MKGERVLAPHHERCESWGHGSAFQGGRRPLGRDRRRLGAAPETRPWFSRPCLRSCPDFQNGFEPRIVHS
jgi:hypothetical protein